MLLKEQTFFLPLETAKILVNDDKDKEGINKEAYAKLKEATEKAQKVYDEEKSIDKILEEQSNIDKALEEYTKHKDDKETVPGNNKPEDKPTPDNKPNNNSDNNGTVDNTKPSDNSNSSTANDNANNSSNNTNNSSTEAKPGNNENTGNNKPENKPNNNSNAGSTNTNNNVTTSEDIINNIFSNDASGVKVTLTDKTTATKLSATPVEDKALANSVLEKLNLPADNQIRILDLKLLDKNNKVVNSNTNRTVAIVLKEDEKDVAVYHIKENGDLELMRSKIKDGKVIFEINHFSKFAIVTNKPKQNNENSGDTSINNNTSNSSNNHDTTHNNSNSGNSSNIAQNDSNVDNTSTLGHNNSNNKHASTTVQNNQPTQISPLNSSVSSSINNSKLGKHLAKTGLSNNNLASLAAIGLVLSGALILGRRKNKR